MIYGYTSIDQDTEECEMDNRDLSTTELTSNKDKITFTVYPWDLLENLIENNVDDGNYCDLLIQELKGIRKKIEVYQDTH